MVVNFKATNANTSASTLNVNGLGVIAIKKNSSAALTANDILAGQLVTVAYDGTNFQMQSQSGNATASGGVNAGLINQLAYYAAAGNVVSGLATAASGVLVTSAGSVPSISSTLPTGLAMNTPLSITLTNGTGLPISTGVSGLGTGVATFLGTPSSANLAAAITDETGSGALVFANTPTLVTPVLGVATATSVNKVTLTAPATSATLTILDGKTLTIDNTMTTTSTDGATVNFGAGGTVLYTGGAGGFTWVAASGATQSAAVNTGYITTNAGQCVVTAPAVAAVGSIVGAQSTTSGGFSMVANTGQTIKYLGTTTSSGGSLTSIR